jgi:hypothetical protein
VRTARLDHWIEAAKYLVNASAGFSALMPLPEPITDPDQIAHLNIHRRDRIGGVLHEYQHAA